MVLLQFSFRKFFFGFILFYFLFLKRMLQLIYPALVPERNDWKWNFLAAGRAAPHSTPEHCCCAPNSNNRDKWCCKSAVNKAEKSISRAGGAEPGQHRPQAATVKPSQVLGMLWVEQHRVGGRLSARCLLLLLEFYSLCLSLPQLDCCWYRGREFEVLVNEGKALIKHNK